MRLAAEAGDARAQANLAEMYTQTYRGTVMIRYDVEEAKKWCDRARKQGYEIKKGHGCWPI